MGFDIIFTIVSIFIGVVFIFTILMFVSPKLRGKFMSRQVRALKHMTDYSKKDFEDISYNMADAGIKAKTRVIDSNYDNLKETATKEANIKKDALTIKTKAIKDGIFGNTVYCKHCGGLIDENSKFCKHCGKKL